MLQFELQKYSCGGILLINCVLLSVAVRGWLIVKNHISKKSIDQTKMNINNEIKISSNKLSTPLSADGGKVFVNRLVHLFGLTSKVALSEFIGVSTGSLATWQTRGTVPFELAIRIHLATGVSIEYLLFDELKGDLNVMQYLPDPTLQANYANIKNNLANFHYSLTKPAHYDGGSILIERLVSLFKLSSKKELGELLDVSVGTLGTWQARMITPHELLCRIHLATGVSIHYLCFGKEWDLRKKERESKNAWMHGEHHFDKPKYENKLKVESSSSHDWLNENKIDSETINIYSIDNGPMVVISDFAINDNFLTACGIDDDCFAINKDKDHYFIDPKIVTVSKGCFLYCVNDIYQLGEFRQLPDGKLYLNDNEALYPVDTSITKIVGKVVSVLKKT
ncbi:helix-turn-helix domain-containing protein [Shewanella sp. ULN5]|uniref:helix-turn-helix domain-containing protein n=1 Tax=Shewanella sp. ULN5 TaxID=2994678 RepID=UPI0027401915|nr:helix-turn-helix domain-containing protein [Shewanella sp. ULN5]MDP5146032.1 helix-turn-helix domain-containing protein [Shewanella sp. ULN5]